MEGNMMKVLDTDKHEQQCVFAFSNGDKDAFALLFLKYQPGLVSFINSFIKDVEVARDISQDVFLKLWVNRAECAQLKSFKAYLFKTAKFAIYDYFDHSLVNDKYVQQALRQEVPMDNAEDNLFAGQLQEMVDMVINSMPAARKRIFEMSRKEGLSNAEIAERLNISKRTVENQITAALAQIRKVVKIFVMLFA